MLLSNSRCSSCLSSPAKDGRQHATVVASNPDRNMCRVCGLLQLWYRPCDLANSAVPGFVLATSVAIFCTAWYRRCGSTDHLSADPTTLSRLQIDPSGGLCRPGAGHPATQTGWGPIFLCSMGLAREAFAPSTNPVFQGGTPSWWSRDHTT